MSTFSKGDVVTVAGQQMVVLDFMDAEYAWVCSGKRCQTVMLLPVQDLTFVRKGGEHHCTRLPPKKHRAHRCYFSERAT